MGEATDRMDFEAFIECMREAVAKRTNLPATVQEVFQNNGVKLHGMTVLQKEINIAPMIYLENFYEQYQKNGFAETLEEVLKTYEENKPSDSVDIEFFTEYEKIRPYLRLRLIHYKSNKERLKDILHYQYLDFAVVLTIVLTDQKNVSATILVHDCHTKYWECSKEELFKMALNNMKEDFHITTMREVLQELFGDNEFDFTLGSKDACDDMMYIMTNQSGEYGAATILIPGALKQFADAAGVKEVYILPCSIHEVILIPCKGVPEKNIDVQGLTKMVQEVNTSQLQRKDILSDSVYLYNEETDILDNVTKKTEKTPAIPTTDITKPQR